MKEVLQAILKALKLQNQVKRAKVLDLIRSIDRENRTIFRIGEEMVLKDIHCCLEHSMMILEVLFKEFVQDGLMTESFVVTLKGVKFIEEILSFDENIASSSLGVRAN